MKARAIILVLWCLLAPTAFSATERSPHELFDVIKALRVDPSNVYHLAPTNRIELRRGDAVLSFEEGTLAFFSPLDGQITGAVFLGRGHVLAVPRDLVEKQQMGRFLGAPILDEEFSNAYLRFTDDTAGELLRQFHAADLVTQVGVSFAAQWESTLTQFNPGYTLRILLDRLSPNPKPCFYAALEGAAAVSVRAETGTERVLVFQLSRALTLDKVTDEQGQSLAFFQNEGISLQERGARGNDYLYVVLPETPARQREFTLHFHYRGNVIEDAGNGVLFVGARESWYPRLGDNAQFSAYDFQLRWPRRLLLVATGAKIDEREDGDFRIGRWRTEKPVAVAGFNLGEYASASVTSGALSVDVYANRQLEESLKKRLASSDRGAFVGLPSSSPRISAAEGRSLPSLLPSPSTPSPADALKQLGKEIDLSIRFYETFSGPFPFHTLSVSQIPGSFAQGWPGLLYLSTYSYLPRQAQERAGLSTSGQEHYTELVPFHEVAHQWWGNVVGWSSYRDEWIDEALAQYLALLFADTQKNPDHTLRVWLQRFRQRILEKPPGASEPRDEIGALTLGLRLNSSKSPDGYEEVIYTKGAWIIHMLREMLRQPGARNPDARFVVLLQTLVTKYAYRALSTGDLQREVETVMTPGMDLEGGRSMEWFFDEWVRGTGIPRYRVEFTAHHNEKGYLIRGKLFQTRVPRSFIAGVPLYAGAAGHNTFLGTVVAAGPETS